jgi:hypothetical protein
MSDPFKDSRIKISTARRHLKHLTDEISGYRSRNPISIMILPSKDFTGHRWCLWVHEEAPDDFPAYVGDILHNLRAALDIMAVTLVTLNGNNPKSVYFPFADNATDFPMMVKKRNFDLAGADAVKLVQKIGPYRGGDNLLRAVHDADIDDKHKGLVPLTHFSGIAHAVIGGAQFSSIRVAPVRSGQCVIDGPKDPRYSYWQKFPALIDFVFPHESAFPDGEITSALAKIIDHCEAVFQSFVSLRTGKKP